MKVWNFNNELKQLFVDYHYASINDPIYTSTQAYKHLERIPKPIAGDVRFSLDYSLDQDNLFENALMTRHSWPYKFPNNVTIDVDFLSKFCQLAFIGNDKTGRTYPSGGAQYYVNIYLLLNESKVCEKLVKHNVYQLDMDSQQIVGLNFTKWEEIQEAYIPKASVETAQMAIALSVNLHHVSEKYTDISYKLIQQEAGHIGQNIQLVSNYMNLKSLPLGGFYDLKLSEIIGNNEAVLYTFLLG
ncbi:SagB/ThcOx family dehydrogenase [Sporosarcina sp. NPDC096371]|uniref:SagB/ThcOx family dehydrogenase n=1 Tax=Sporosarcina sp. NPDC096371 TaxID=3364530 RepID=UPI00380FC4D1